MDELLTSSQPSTPAPSIEPATPVAQDTDAAQASDTAEEGTQAEKPAIDPIQKRINQITAQRYAAERQATEAAIHAQQTMAENEQLRTYLKSMHARQSLPDPAQFATAEDYYRYQQQQMERQQTHDLEQQNRQMDQQRQYAQQAQWNTQVQLAAQMLTAQASTKHADFEVVINNPQLPDLTKQHPAVVQALFSSDKAGDVVYHLAKNPQEAHRLAALPPVEQIRELGRIEARIAARPNASPPNPLSPMPGGSTTTSGLSNKLSTDEWAKRFLKSYSKR